jgi:hypothetical protein
LQDIKTIIYFVPSNKTNLTHMEATAIKAELNAQILFSKPNAIFVGRIVEIREKAIKVDYYWQPIWGGISKLEIFEYSAFMPLSVLMEDKDRGLTVKKWFANKFTGGHNIKKYYVKDGVKTLYK